MKMNNDKVARISDAYSLFTKIFAGFVALLTLGAGIYEGVNSVTKSEQISWIVGGFLGALLIILAFIAVETGIAVWGKVTDWLTEHIRKYPYLRFWIVFPSILFSLYSAYLVFKFLETDLSLRILISAYLVFVLPAAIVSLVRDDLRRERARLSKIISRETRIHNPQAAIENAFTHFEDHLLKRVSGDSNKYGVRLIKFAYEGDKSKLIYKSDGKDYTPQLLNLMVGAYGVFRNPRHHKIVEDDEDKAQTLISLSELLIEFVDASEDRKEG